MDPRLVTAVIVVLGVPAVLVGYIWLTERVLGLLGQRARARLRPWLWLAPALAFLAVFLVYPTIGTLDPQLPEQGGHEVRRTRQLRLVLQQRRVPASRCETA